MTHLLFSIYGGGGGGGGTVTFLTHQQHSLLLLSTSSAKVDFIIAESRKNTGCAALNISLYTGQSKADSAHTTGTYWNVEFWAVFWIRDIFETDPDPYIRTLDNGSCSFRK